MLTPDRIHLIRTAGKSDHYWARLWRMTPSAIRQARTGGTWPNHPTPPDRRPRLPGRRGDAIVLKPEPAPAVNLSRLISSMPRPASHPTGAP